MFIWNSFGLESTVNVLFKLSIKVQRKVRSLSKDVGNFILEKWEGLPQLWYLGSVSTFSTVFVIGEGQRSFEVQYVC